MPKYNGYKNYVTWNIALWLNNDEGLYNDIKENKFKGYLEFVDYVRDHGIIETPDGVAFNDSGLDIKALNKVVKRVYED